MMCGQVTRGCIECNNCEKCAANHGNLYEYLNHSWHMGLFPNVNYDKSNLLNAIFRIFIFINSFLSVKVIISPLECMFLM